MTMKIIASVTNANQAKKTEELLKTRIKFPEKLTWKPLQFEVFFFQTKKKEKDKNNICYTIMLTVTIRSQ